MRGRPIVFSAVGRRKRHSEHANHERWLVSYADFITLLFAFFVVLFAVSQVDSEKLGRLAESVAEATKQEGILEGGDKPLADFTEHVSQLGLLAGHQPRAADSTMRRIRKFLARDLAGVFGDGRMSLARGDDGLIVRVNGAAAFEPAKSQLRPEVLDDLTRVGRALSRFRNAIRIEGHTDSAPIRNSAYRSNWELSAARAVAVLDHISQSAQVPHTRMSIAGYASQRPIADNQTEEGRSQNRRVDIVVLDGRSPRQTTEL